MSLQSNYFWMRSRAGEVMLGRHWCDTLELREAGGLWELELGPWYIFFNLCLVQMLFVACVCGGCGTRGDGEQGELRFCTHQPRASLGAGPAGAGRGGLRMGAASHLSWAAGNGDNIPVAVSRSCPPGL